MDLFVQTFVSYTKNILPWIAVGSVVVYIVDRSVDVRIIRTFLGKVTIRNILTSQVLGMISPFSIMSALPVTGELISLGASPLMLLSFLVAERAYDLQSFLIISDLFGLKIAVLNALVIFVSLVITAWCFRKEKIKIVGRKVNSIAGFFRNQMKTLLVVFIGITIGAVLRVVVPLTGLGLVMSSWIGGLMTSLILGFGLYFGTILGNYPVAKSLADLGMSHVGTMVFLSVSPILNLVVIMLFLSVVEAKYIIKIIGFYSLVSLLLSIIASSIV